MDSGLALALIVIAAFAVFILWGKSAAGKATLRNTLGETHSFQKRQRMARKRRALTGARPSGSRSTKRPSR
jgi:hypothetical protein